MLGRPGWRELLCTIIDFCIETAKSQRNVNICKQISRMLRDTPGLFVVWLVGLQPKLKPTF